MALFTTLPPGHPTGSDRRAHPEPVLPPGAGSSPGQRAIRTPALRLLLWRLRRPATACCAALAAFLTVCEVRSPGPPTTAVLVAARDLPAGTTLTSDDVTYRSLPTATLPDGTADDSAVLLGIRTAVAVPAGLPLVTTLLTDMVVTGPPGTVVVPVRFADQDAAALLTPGLRIDVISAPVGAEPCTVANDVLVLTAPEPDSSNELLTGDDSGLLLVAVDPDQAIPLTAANASASLFAILVE